MIEKNTKINKQKPLKTEPFYQSQCATFELGKPIVRLPIINKKSGALRFRYDNTLDKSLDSKEKSTISKTNVPKQDTSLNVQELILRKYSNNSQLQLLTFEELQLCTDKSKKILPKIAMGAPSRQHTDRSPHDQFHKRLNRMKSQKKIDSSITDLGSYKLGSILGRGNYSIVKLCQTSEGKKYAAKVYSKKKINSSQREQNLLQQIKILKSVQHPNIIAFKQHVETEENHYIVMQVFDNISLLDFVKKQMPNEQRERDQSYSQRSSQNNTTRFRQKPRLQEPMARTIARKIIEAFCYLHDHGIAHRDVKLENVLIGNQSKQEIAIKIIDFGFSRQVIRNQEPAWVETKENKKQIQRKNSKCDQETVFFDYCGTPSYISPQIIEKKGYLARPSDVWALGVLLFFLATGFFPFKSVSQKSDFSNSVYHDFIHQNIKLSASLVAMLRKMLKNDPMGRPTVRELLKEPWLNIDH